MYKILFFSLFLGVNSLAENYKITIEWNYKKANDIKMKIYTVEDNQELWLTRNVTSLNGTGIKDLIKDNTLMVQPNMKKKFALVTFNNTDKPIYFFAAPHSTTPEELSLGLRFKCLCINHAFKVEPKNYWTRIVELRLDPGYKAKKMKIKHTITQVDKDFAETFKTKSPEHEHEH